jgi:WD40 repeat protein
MWPTFLLADSTSDQKTPPLPKGAVRRINYTFRPYSLFRFSPDGKIVCIEDYVRDSTARLHLWDAHTWKELRTFPQDADSHCQGFSPDGKFLICGNNWKEYGIEVWDVATGRHLRAMRQASGWDGSHLAISPVGTILAIPNVTIPRFGKAWKREIFDKQEIEFWDWSTGKELRERRIRIPQMFRHLRFSPNGRILAGNFNFGKGICLWDVATGQLVQTLAEGQACWESFSFSADGRLVAGMLPRKPRHPRDPRAADAPLDPSERRMNSISGKVSVIVLWELASGKEIYCIEPKNDFAPPFAFSFDGRLLAATDIGSLPAPLRDESARQYPSLELWDAHTGKRLHRFDVKKEPWRWPTFVPDNKLLATTDDRSTLLWDISTFNRPRPSAPDLSDAALTRLWADLASDDIGTARKAVWSLTVVARQSVPLFREHLRPVPHAAPSRIKNLISDLNSEQFETRERASAELERLGEIAASAMKKALADKPSLEMRRRLEPLLAKLKRPYTSAERLRTLRALEALEHIGNDEAKKILRTMADGAPGTAETEDAKASLKRLDARR